MNKPIAVIGAGAWGTSLAMVLAQNGYAVRLWEYFPEYALHLQTTRDNTKFLPGVKIPESIVITSDLGQAAADCDDLILVCPSQALRSVVRRLKEQSCRPDRVVSASKGIEKNSLARMSEIIREEFGSGPQVCALSGPSHAEEVSRGLPCSIVAASPAAEAGAHVQKLFSTDRLRVYTSPDIIGVELGGSLKNVIALAAGVVDGLGLGDNTKAALLTRGLAEICRLGKAMGANPETFAGLSGMGDLVVTCTSRHSRNRRVGEELGRGRTLAEILSNMEMVAEGVDTSRSAKQLAERMGVDMPITFQVNRILFEGVSAAEALVALMQRPPKPEVDPGLFTSAR
jgi:glycerol-3-phosphate dehydrogenase (NAD(P)+)